MGCLSQGVVHRSVRASHILISETGSAVLGGFRYCTSLHATGAHHEKRVLGERGVVKLVTSSVGNVFLLCMQRLFYFKEELCNRRNPPLCPLRLNLAPSGGKGVGAN